MSQMRIVSLSPSVTEILCALGLEGALVGTDKWSDHPASVRDLPKVGGVEADLDKVRALAPDLVVACTSVPSMGRTVSALGAAAAPVVVAEPRDLASVSETIRQIGLATGTEVRAAELIARSEVRRSRVADATRSVAKRPRVYWEWWPKPLAAAGGGNWMSALIEMAGGVNVFADEAASTVKPDAVLVGALDPEVVVLCWCGAKKPPRIEDVLERPGWERVTAVVERAVFTVPEGLFARPGPRLMDGLEQLASLLHPELAGAWESGR